MLNIIFMNLIIGAFNYYLLQDDYKSLENNNDPLLEELSEKLTVKLQIKKYTLF